VFAAEDYSERQVHNTKNTLISVDVVFVLLILVALAYIIRSVSVKRRADILGTIAYIDALTQLENRASCERLINEIKASPPEDSIAVIMFDMNNLKLVNDFIGHQGGDKVIIQFAAILKETSAKYGFIGRYGGDEFLGIFKKTNEDLVKTFISEMQDNTDAYNSLKVNDIEKISYAVGYAMDCPRDTGIDDLIYEADRNMYMNKREMKSRSH
jgi:diguanylate cyclase (GGDEF)-like protein